MGITFCLLVFESYSLMSKLNTLSNPKKFRFLSMGSNRLHHNTYIHTYIQKERRQVIPIILYIYENNIGTLKSQLVAGQGGKCSSAKTL